MSNIVKLLKEHKETILVVLLIIAIGIACVSIGYIIGSKNQRTNSEISSTKSNTTSPTESELDGVDNKYLEIEGQNRGKDYEANLDYIVLTEKDPLNIREEPRKDSDKTGDTLSRGESVWVRETENNWGYIDWDGKCGWIDLDYCFAPYGTTVWVTLTDNAQCYHLPWCRTIQDYEPIQVDYNYASNDMKRRECKVCYGKVERLFKDIRGYTLSDAYKYD